MADSARIKVEVDGRELSLSNLHKVLYPEDGFTKGEVIDYYRQVAPALLPAIADRAATRKRYPDGVDASSFFEKNAPSHTPGWIRTVTLPSPGSSRNREEVTYVVVDDLPTLVWCANLAVLELHVPQWTVGPRGGVRAPDLLVLDLDPGPGTDVVQCCEVGVWLREALEDDGFSPVAKTSGSKGMQLYAPVAAADLGRTSAYAKALAERLEEEHPELVVSRMTKSQRVGKVLIDWSQNNPAKTTVAPYSLRARPHPTVSTPVTWDEVVACR
ncbi:MAG: non-homologous end-joining DNA ligase, partial [Actinomycetota bacterium]|nr:non-homologous end-joining DNA ligase [Actinomycetota bacterium]